MAFDPVSDVSSRFSLVTPVFDPDVAHLRACLDSVAAQTAGLGSVVEHVLVDDGSAALDVLQLLAEYGEADGVVVHRRDSTGGIVAATNDGLARASGTWVGFLDHDDVLESHAVEAVLRLIEDADKSAQPIDVAYTDHDFIDPTGELVGTAYKPDWSPERLRHQNYITHFVAVRRALLDEVGGLRTGFDGAQDHDLMLRLGERARRVAHLPETMYHWRQAPTSVSAGTGAKPWAFDAGRRAIADHLDRVGVAAEVTASPHEGISRVIRAAPVTEPLVSVIIPTRGASGVVWGRTRCFVVEAVRSLVDRSNHQNFEFVVVVDDDTPPAVCAALAEIAGDALQLVPFAKTFNFSTKMNLGAAAATGDLLLLLNDDTELIDPGSVSQLVALVGEPAAGHHGCDGPVGMAGARLLFHDGTLQHGGHIYNVGPHHACYGWPGDHPGPDPLLPLAAARECSGVTAAAAVVARATYHEVGGFDEELPLNYNDVDFSLKIRASGRRIVYEPEATWYHFESKTRESRILPEETDWIEQHWGQEMRGDPYYHPALVPLRFDWLEPPPLDVPPASLDRDLPRRAVKKFRRQFKEMIRRGG